VLTNQIAAFFSLVLAVLEVAKLVSSGADFCAGYLLSFYLAAQILFFVFIACNELFLGDRTVAEHRKKVFPWFDLAISGFVIQVLVIVCNFLLNTRGGHC
jgi:putative flippase GtrA